MTRDRMEDRVVDALKARGLLRQASLSWYGAFRAAAALALFVGGAVAGRWTSGSLVSGDAAALRDRSPALEVQSAGSAYIAALAQISAEPEGAERDVAQEVAVSSLRGVVAEVARVDSTGVALTLLRAAVAEAERDRANPRS